MSKEKEGFIINNVKRNWQAECIYNLIMEHKDSIKFVLNGRILVISNFENCRERGYTLRISIRNNETKETTRKELSFAENRNSDSIVVYPFEWNNENCEKDYETKTKYFKPESFYEVFDYILKYFDIKL